jgi:hypothetical protein
MNFKEFRDLRYHRVFRGSALGSLSDVREFLTHEITVR